MKISRINIEDYHQFKGFDLDLTYPAGHEKAGQPLDKVCFIGQSGTGKTTLLNVVRAIVSHGLIEKSYVHSDMINIDAETHFDNGLNRHVWIRNGEVTDKIDRLVHKRKRTPKWTKDFLREHYSDTNLLVSFPAEIQMNLSQIFQEDADGDSPLDFFRKKQVEPQEGPMSQVEQGLKLKFFDFEVSNVRAVWDTILKDIQDYKIKQLSLNQRLTNQLSAGAMDAEKLVAEFKAWQEQNPNPIKDLSAKLNPLLNRFNLEIRPEFEFESAEDLRFINIHQKGGTLIPHNFWSTGTKQVIMTATPLFKLNTDRSIILMDEPERSLYPDIQAEIVNFYATLAPKAQFFFATHSPLVASCFDPWEIVELKFDENGHIIQDRMHEGERDIQNYKLHPKYLRWDSILQRIFDLDKEGNEAREKKLQELAELDVRLKAMKTNGQASQEERSALWQQFQQVAEQLDWKITTHEKN